MMPTDAVSLLDRPVTQPINVKPNNRPPMTPMDAILLLDRLVRDLRGTRLDHDLIKEAVSILRNLAIEPPQTCVCGK